VPPLALPPLALPPLPLLPLPLPPLPVAPPWDTEVIVARELPFAQKPKENSAPTSSGWVPLGFTTTAAVLPEKVADQLV
jgi:hypothetical protein